MVISPPQSLAKYDFDNWPTWAKLLGLWIISKLLFLLIIFLVKPTSKSFLDIMFLWDGRWYLEIATKGYSFVSIYQESSVAFPPLFPITGWLIGRIGILVGFDSTISIAWGLIISANIFSFFAIKLMYRYLIGQMASSVAIRVIALILFSPAGWVLSLPYSESLFLFLIVQSLITIQEKKYIPSSFIIMALTLTRTLGIIFAGNIAIQSIREKNWAKAIVSGLLLTAFLLIAGYYYNSHFGDPLVAFKSHAAWNRSFALFPLTIIYQMLGLYRFLYSVGSIKELYEGLFVRAAPFFDTFLQIFTVALCIKYWRLGPKHSQLVWVLYLFMTVSYPAYSLTLPTNVSLSFARHTLMNIPIFILIASKYPKVINISVSIFCIYAALMVNSLYIP